MLAGITLWGCKPDTATSLTLIGVAACCLGNLFRFSLGIMMEHWLASIWDLPPWAYNKQAGLGAAHRRTAALCAGDTRRDLVTIRNGNMMDTRQKSLVELQGRRIFAPLSQAKASLSDTKKRGGRCTNAKGRKKLDYLKAAGGSIQRSPTPRIAGMKLSKNTGLHKPPYN